MKIRDAVLEDAPAMGRVTVETWLSTHHGQMPDSAWEKRLEEWTPDASARSWARFLSKPPGGDHARFVLLVAEDESGDPIALVFGTELEDDESGATAQINSLYVLAERQGQGIGQRLLQQAASELTSLAFSRLHIGVLSANHAARAFYEAMGGHEIGQGTFDEEGYLLFETVYAWHDLRALAGECTEPA